MQKKHFTRYKPMWLTICPLSMTSLSPVMPVVHERSVVSQKVGSPEAARGDATAPLSLTLSGLNIEITTLNPNSNSFEFVGLISS